jgi:hypothetical protein
MIGRIPVQLHGGPFDGMTISARDDTVETGMVFRGQFAVYEIKGRWGSFVGMRPGSWAEGGDGGQARK